MSKSTHGRSDDPEALDEFAPADAADPTSADRIRGGDAVVFEALFRAYWHPLNAFALRYVQSKEEAEEVVQDVFFRIWRGRAEWHPTVSVRSYLYAAVRNAAHDRLDRAAAAYRWRERQVHEQAGAPAPGAHEIETRLESAELLAAVERALAELPVKRLAVCRMRLIDGLSYTQIADRLGINAKTVETQLARGRKFLRERFRELSYPALSVTAATLLRILS
jgi:RNA polymerase sigma-70 factor (ECF subfamily)